MRGPSSFGTTHRRKRQRGGKTGGADDRHGQAREYGPRIAPVKWQRPVGPTSFNRIRESLRAVLSKPVKEGLLAVNVANLVELPPPNRTRPKVWTPDLTGEFLDFAVHHPLDPLYHLLAHTGLRRRRDRPAQAVAPGPHSRAPLGLARDHNGQQGDGRNDHRKHKLQATVLSDLECEGAPSGTRTPNPLVKSQLLCQLS